MYKLAVIGNDVRRSLSKKIHIFLNKKKNLNISYLKLTVDNKKFLKVLILFFLNYGYIINVTMPFKNIVTNLCNYLTKTSLITGSTNTIYIYKNSFIGYNTDNVGFIKSMSSVIKIKKQTPCIILGYSGVLQGISVSLKKYKNIHIYIYNRNLINVYFKLEINNVNFPVNIIKRKDKKKIFYLVINTIPNNQLFNISNMYIFKKKNYIFYNVCYLNKKNVHLGKKKYTGEYMLYFQALESFHILNEREKIN